MLWLLGFFGLRFIPALPNSGNLIHVLLIIIIIVIVVRLLSGLYRKIMNN